VFLTLICLGIVFGPPLLYYCSKWGVEGARADPNARRKDLIDKKFAPYLMVIGISVINIFGITLGLAFLTAGACWLFAWIFSFSIPFVLAHAGLGMLVGIPLVIIPSYFLLFRKNMPIHKLFEWLHAKEA